MARAIPPTAPFIAAFEAYLPPWDTLLQAGIIAAFEEGKTAYAAHGAAGRIYLHFEYDYDSLSLYAWLMQADGTPLSDYMRLLDANARGDAFCPASFLDDCCALEDETGNEDAFLGACHELYGKAHAAFEQWFIRNYRAAAARYPAPFPADFSIHDTNYTTDLATGETVTYDNFTARL